MANSNRKTTSSTSQKRGSKRNQEKIAAMSNTTYAAGLGGAVKRIRTPGQHDVLSGRGGGINSHVGNIQFRKWVHERKNDYNLAATKAEKAVVAKQVIALVKNQSPPGRFLQKDQSATGTGGLSGWWVEIEEDKCVAKTSQALREGAPLIRAAHKDELAEHKTKSGRKSHRKQTATANTAAKIAETVLSQNAPPAAVPVLTMAAATASAIDTAATTQQQQQQQQQQKRKATEPPLIVKGIRHSVLPEQQPPVKRVRVTYKGHALHPAAASPPLTAVPVITQPAGEMPALALPSAGPTIAKKGGIQLGPRPAASAAEGHNTPPLLSAPEPAQPPAIEELAPLPPPALPHQGAPAAAAVDYPRFPSPRRLSGDQGLQRVHSLGLSEVSEGDRDWANQDFVNPFENEGEWEMVDMPWRSNFSSSSSAPRPGIMRESRDSITSNGDMGGIGALMRPPSSSNSSSPLRGVPSRNSMGNSSSRSLTSVLSDLPDASSSQRSQHAVVNGADNTFMEGMKVIYDALHPDLEEESVPTHLYPYRGGGASRRQSSSSSGGAREDGRQ